MKTIHNRRARSVSWIGLALLAAGLLNAPAAAEPALQFTRANSNYLHVPSFTWNAQHGTIEFWFSPKDNAGSGQWNTRFDLLTGQSTGGANRFLLYREASTTLRFFYVNSAGTGVYVDIPTTGWQGGQFYHFALHFSDGGNAGVIRVFINGSEVGSTAVTGTMGSHNQINLMRDVGNQNYTDGRLAEVRLWNTLRTAQEIQGHMNVRLTGEESGLVGYWPLDEGSGTTANDLSPSGKNGTIYGADWTTTSDLTLMPPAAPDPDLPQIANIDVTGHTDTSADIVGSLASNGVEAASITLYWATTDYATNATDWVAHGGSMSVGPYADGETFTNTVSGLSANTLYYWNHRAVNASGTVWAARLVSPSFKTLGPPSVDNGVGATIVRSTTARLNGTLLDGAPAHLFLSWWADGSGTTNVVELGSRELGGVFANLTGLTPATAYSYRAWASNDYGTVWAPAASGFTTRTGPYYVALNGAAPNDGASWATAFTNVQEAIDFAAAGDTIYLKGETFTLPANHANGKLVWSGKGLTIDGGYAADGGTPGARTSTATVLRNTTSISYAVSAADTANRVLYASSVTNGTLRNVILRGGTVRNAFGANVYMTGCTNLLMDAVTIESGHQWQYHSGQARGGGVYALNSWGSISNSIIQHNTIAGQWGTYVGHGIYLVGGGWALRDSIIRNNRDTSTAGSSTYRGMGLYIQSGTHTVQNCLIARNFCENFTSGSGVYVEGGSLTMQNATVFWHPVSGIQRAAGTVTIRDSIVWNNGDDLVGTGITLQNNCIEDGDSNGVNGNFASDPRFERGFYLAANSPCVNTGSTTVAAAGLTGYTTRADGTADEGTVDLGYHFPPGSATVDYYVDAVTGADSNTGLVPGSAFKTLTKALSVIGDGSRVNVAAGTYNVANGETFPLSVNNRYGVQILGAGRDATIIDANTAANRRCMNMTYVYPDAAISGLTLKRGSLTSGIGGGLYLASVQGSVTDVAITDNAITTSGWGGPAGGGLYAIQCAVTVSNCLIARNTLTPWYPESSYGGGIFASGAASGPLAILNSTIVSNTASVGGGQYGNETAFGGGLYLSGNATLRNCLITHNDARSTSTTGKTPRGDAAYVAGGTVLFENCTVVTNHPAPHGRGGDSYTGGLGIERAGGTVNIRNSILWGNGDDLVGTIASISHSNVEDGDGNGSNGNISADPQFAAPLAGNYRLLKASPCVNAGTNLTWMTGAVDLDGNARLQNKRVDMGAYETFIPAGGTVLTIR